MVIGLLGRLSVCLPFQSPGLNSARDAELLKRFGLGGETVPVSYVVNQLKEVNRVEVRRGEVEIDGTFSGCGADVRESESGGRPDCVQEPRVCGGWEERRSVDARCVDFRSGGCFASRRFWLQTSPCFTAAVVADGFLIGVHKRPACPSVLCRVAVSVFPDIPSTGFPGSTMGIFLCLMDFVVEPVGVLVRFAPVGFFNVLVVELQSASFVRACVFENPVLDSSAHGHDRD